MIRSSKNILLLILVLVFTANVKPSHGQSKNYIMVIAGLGGSPEYTEKYKNYLKETRTVFTGNYKIPAENVVMLGETKIVDSEYVNDVSNAESIKKYINDFSTRINEDDTFFLILFGHGSFDGKNSYLNIPRKDLSDEEYDGLLDNIKAGKIVVINTASASFPFIDKLSKPGRIIITATKSGTQKNQPLFGQYLVEAFTNPASDLDKNGILSVLEVFSYSSERTFRWYEDNNHLATEHPQIEDTGDKLSSRINEIETSGEGSLASITYFKNRMDILLAGSNAEADSVLVRLLGEQEQVEREIAELKVQKDSMDEDSYFAKLEEFLIKLAEISDEIEKRKKDK